MKNYARIVSMLQDTPWLITEGGLRQILQIMNAHLDGNFDIEKLRQEAKDARRERGSLPSQHGSVGILPLHGPIFPKANLMTELSGATSMEQFTQDFRELMNNDRVESILLDVDSPGGSSFMLEEMAQEIRAARDVKPIYSVANTMACSAAYYLASQASEMYASDSSMTGSIGTFMVHTDESQLAENVGIKQTVIKEGRFKAAEILPLTDESHEYLQSVVKDANDQFIASVAAGRNTTVENVIQNYGEGGVVSAKKALDAGMVDGIRTYDEVLGAMLNGGGTSVLVESAGSGFGGFSLRASFDKEKEHSEPGSGLGGEPQPRVPPEDEQQDDWKKSGARLQRPPNLPELDEETQMNRELLLQYAERLGISNAVDLDDSDLATKVTEALDTQAELVSELREATQVATEQVAFAQAYPEQAQELRELREVNRQNAAVSFANSLADFEVAGAEEGETTRYRLSSLAQEVVKQSHIKLSAGSLDAEGLKSLIETVAKGGVEMGEIGSSRMDETVDVAQATGNRQQDRKAFADKVSQLMTEDNLDRKAATSEAAKRYPELAEAYVSN
jgi:signal peptide peptidase SppA